MPSSTLEDYSEKDDYGEHNQHCTEAIKKQKDFPEEGAFKKNLEENTSIFQAIGAGERQYS